MLTCCSSFSLFLSLHPCGVQVPTMSRALSPNLGRRRSLLIVASPCRGMSWCPVSWRPLSCYASSGCSDGVVSSVSWAVCALGVHVSMLTILDLSWLGGYTRSCWGGTTFFVFFPYMGYPHWLLGKNSLDIWFSQLSAWDKVVPLVMQLCVTSNTNVLQRVSIRGKANSIQRHWSRRDHSACCLPFLLLKHTCALPVHLLGLQVLPPRIISASNFFWLVRTSSPQGVCRGVFWAAIGKEVGSGCLKKTCDLPSSWSSSIHELLRQVLASNRVWGSPCLGLVLIFISVVVRVLGCVLPPSVLTLILSLLEK